MNSDVIALFVVNAAGWLVMAGVGWQKLKGIAETQEDLVGLYRDMEHRQREQEQFRERVETIIEREL